MAEYLARHGFAPHPGNPTWLDLDTGQQIIRVLHEPGEETLLICLSPRQRLPVRGHVQPGTPDAVIIAAIEAALRRRRPAQPPRAPRPGTAHRHERRAPRRKA